jgi:hypothetical protein
MKKRSRPAASARDSENGERTPAWRSLFDVQLIEMVLQDAARSGKALSYSETLYRLGHHFTRPKMRALCVALGEVDDRAQRRGEPALAVLVVRASDGLPGAGWWICKDRRRYQGPWEGPEAKAYIKKKQGDAFRFWRPEN